MQNSRVTSRCGVVRPISFAFVLAMLSFGAFRAAAQLTVTASPTVICSGDTLVWEAATSCGPDPGPGGIRYVVVAGEDEYDYEDEYEYLGGQSVVLNDVPGEEVAPTGGWAPGEYWVLAEDNCGNSGTAPFFVAADGTVLAMFYDQPRGTIGQSINFTTQLYASGGLVSGVSVNWVWTGALAGPTAHLGNVVATSYSGVTVDTSTPGAIFAYYSIPCGLGASDANWVSEVTSSTPSPGAGNPWRFPNCGSGVVYDGIPPSCPFQLYFSSSPPTVSCDCDD